MSKMQKFSKSKLRNHLPIGLYIHVPFCTILCPFCDFYKKSWTPTLEKSYVDALIKEITCYKTTPPIPIETIFLGGGTPSIISKTSLKKMIHAIHTTFDTEKIKEQCFEANPEDITTKRLTEFKSNGFNRISLGVQTFNESECKQLGRGHTIQQSIDAIKTIQTHANWNLSIDLMFSLPNSTLDTLKQSLDQALSFQPNHLSTYGLTIEKNTPFHNKKIRSLSQEKELDQYKLIQTYCNNHGYKQYEVSSFAKPRFECIHNINYWNFYNFIGLGPGAQSFMWPYRFTNRPLNIYCNNPTPALFLEKAEKLDKKTLLTEHIIANLRQRKGIHVPTINHQHQIDFSTHFKPQIQKLTQAKYLTQTEDYLTTTEKGLYVLNNVILEFMS